MTSPGESRLREALEGRAATTTTSPDAWARIGRRVTARDRHRRVIVQLAAAAVVGVVALGGTVALLNRSDQEAVTATGTRSSADAAAESQADLGIAEPEARDEPSRVDRGADGSITFSRGEQVLGVISVPTDPSATAVGWIGSTLFGITATGATDVRVAVEGVPGPVPVELFSDAAVADRVLFVVDDVLAGSLSVESIDAAGNVISVFYVTYRG